MTCGHASFRPLPALLWLAAAWLLAAFAVT